MQGVIMRRARKIFKWIAIVLGVLLGALALFLLFSYLRPNQSQVDPAVVVETWPAVNDGRHNSNTDLIEWNGVWYLIHASSPFHFGSTDTYLSLKRSSDDGRSWEEVRRFNVPGEDIRDPKFTVIGDQLFLYVLKNVAFTAEPYATAYSISADGTTWTPFEAVQPEGWLFWRPKTIDQQTWYVPAYWHEHGKSALLSSTDGQTWNIVSQIYEGDRNDETDIEFQPDGSVLSTARLEFSEDYIGDQRGSTLIATSAAPYTEWIMHTKDLLTRLDGPALFSYNGNTYAVGRYQPDLAWPFAQQGSIMSRKRTSLFQVKPEGLIYLTDLPSAGDTSYAGLVQRGDDLYVDYYTSDINRDWFWLMGMVSPSEIRMARVNLPALEKLAQAKAAQ
jgi:hypothetical protein